MLHLFVYKLSSLGTTIIRKNEELERDDFGYVITLLV